MVMPFYSAECKAALLKMMLPPLSLSAAEVARRKGIFPEPITDWRNAFIANNTKLSAVKNLNAGQSRDDKNRIR
jgi:hypothetical protein